MYMYMTSHIGYPVCQDDSSNTIPSTEVATPAMAFLYQVEFSWLLCVVRGCWAMYMQTGERRPALGYFFSVATKWNGL
jgi:hypothetical protein